MIPGPVEMDDEVLKAAGSIGTSHVDPSFVKTFGSALKNVKVSSGLLTCDWKLVFSLIQPSWRFWLQTECLLSWPDPAPSDGTCLEPTCWRTATKFS